MASSKTKAASKTRIVDAALQLLDEAGLENLTMKKLADALNIQPPSLYWHFPSKSELTNAMADRLLWSAASADYPAGDYRVVLPAVSSEFRAALKSRRDGARLFAGTYAVTDNVMRISDHFIGALRAAGAPTDIATQSAFCIIYFVIGFVIEEQSYFNSVAGEDKTEMLLGHFAALSRDRFPNVFASIPEIMSSDFNQRFDFGLSLIIHGIEHHLAQRRQ